MSSMDLTLKYDSVKANLRNINQQDIYYFDPNESKWVQIPNTTNYSIYNEIYTNINKLGRYTILGSRR